MSKTTQTLSLSDWQALCLSRAKVYHWLSQTMAYELSDAQLASYHEPATHSFLQALADMGYADDIGEIRRSIGLIALQTEGRIDLASDFTHLFLLDQKQSAIPYASYYLEADKRLYGDATEAMQQLLKDNQLAVAKSFNEPADHLAVMLASLAHWCEKSAELGLSQIHGDISQQRAFLQQGLLSWLSAWLVRVEEIAKLGKLSSAFYPALARLLVQFIRDDFDCLEDIAIQSNT